MSLYRPLINDRDDDDVYVATRTREEMSIEDTTRSVTISKTYGCYLRYIYYCIATTTLGRELLHAALPSWRIRFLDTWSQIQRAYFYKGVHFFLFVVVLTMSILFIEDVVTWHVAAYAVAAATTITILAFFADCILFFLIEGPIRAVWDLSMCFHTGM